MGEVAAELLYGMPAMPLSWPGPDGIGGGGGGAEAAGGGGARLAELRVRVASPRRRRAAGAYASCVVWLADGVEVGFGCSNCGGR